MEGEATSKLPSYTQINQHILNIEITEGKKGDDSLLLELAADFLESDSSLTLAYLFLLSNVCHNRTWLTMTENEG